MLLLLEIQFLSLIFLFCNYVQVISCTINFKCISNKNLTEMVQCTDSPLEILQQVENMNHQNSTRNLTSHTHHCFRNSTRVAYGSIRVNELRRRYSYKNLVLPLNRCSLFMPKFGTRFHS